ncbi:MAG: chalcone isomerase family protein [Pseudomonadales bacterium]|nr:chalcone isomerase family protein [Pseudomonadales bacterium]
MKHWFILSIFTIALVGHTNIAQSSPNQDSESASRIVVQGKNLSLNGSGERSKFFTKVYVASLYLSNKSKNPEAIINADEPQLMRLKITSSLITPSLLNSSIKDGLKLSAGDDYDRYASMLDEVMMKNEVPVNINDQFDFFYLPGGGTYISRNGEELGVVPSYRFKQILFGIWLGKSPIQKDLKRSLLES